MRTPIHVFCFKNAKNRFRISGESPRGSGNRKRNKAPFDILLGGTPGGDFP